MIFLTDLSYWQKGTPRCPVCLDQRDLIEVLVNEINELRWKNTLLKRKILDALEIVVGHVLNDLNLKQMQK